MAGDEDAFSPDALWAAARALGDEPELEWTFPLLLFRALALMPEAGGRLTGIDLHYEPLSTWKDTVDVLRVNEALSASSRVPHELAVQISVGMEVFDGIYRCRSGRLELPGPGEAFRGRHSVGVLGLARDGLFPSEAIVFANSWGPDWGDSGIGYIPRRYFEAHVDSVWASRAAWAGPSPAMDRAMKQLSWREGRGGRVDPTDFEFTWCTPNAVLVSSRQVAGREHKVRRRVLFSSAEAMPHLEIIDVCKPGGTIAARMHIRQSASRHALLVEELFVRPEARRQGLGALLLSLAEKRAKAFRSSVVEIWIHEADAGPGLDRALSFGAAKGVEWQPCTLRRPNIARIGMKQLDRSPR